MLFCQWNIVPKVSSIKTMGVNRKLNNYIIIPRKINPKTNL